jgi:ATP-dependent RNA helicase DHX8/PRP22
MAKERRELRQAQANQLIDNMPKDLNRPWEDPIPEAGERLFTQVCTCNTWYRYTYHSY